MTGRKPIMIVAIILYLVLLMVIAAGVFLYLQTRNQTQPAVTFIEPSHQEQLFAHEDVPVRFTAKDPAGIANVELWIDDDLFASKVSMLEEGSSPFPMAEIWQPQAAGSYLLTARATNAKADTSIASVLVHVGDQPIAPEPTPTDPSQAELPISPIPPEGSGTEGNDDLQIWRINPDLILPPLEEKITTYEPDLISSLLLPPLFPREDEAGTSLDVEAISLSTSEGFDGVFCYYSMTGMPAFEKVPEEDWFETAGSREWNIRSFFGDDSKITVVLPADAPNALGMTLECYGVIEAAGAVYNLGMLAVVHSPVDWNGVPIHQHLEGPSGSFDISYRISMADSGSGGGDGEELPPPSLQVDCVRLLNDDVCQLSWTYPEGFEDRLSGFLVVRNGTLYRNIMNPAISTLMLSTRDNSMPDCGESDRYYVQAYGGDLILGERSTRSNAVTVFSLCPYQWSKVSFELFSGCYTGDAVLNTCGEDGTDTDPPALEEDTSNSYDDSNGCLYADFWANDQNLGIGSSDKWDCYDWADGNTYRIGSNQAYVDKNFVMVRLDDRDDLTIRMRVMDDDEINDDTQCDGEYIYTADDLTEIANSPVRRKTYTKWFTRGGGGCALQFSIEMMPPGWDPAFLDDVIDEPVEE